MSCRAIRNMSNKELEIEKLDLEILIDGRSYGEYDYKYYLLILNEIDKRKGS